MAARRQQLAWLVAAQLSSESLSADAWIDNELEWNALKPQGKKMAHSEKQRYPKSLYKLHDDGSIWEYTGAPLIGWLQIDNNPDTTSIVAATDRLYQLHRDGSVWQYTGVPCTGWLQLDCNPATRAIAATDDALYQLHHDGSVWQYTGTPMSGWTVISDVHDARELVTGYACVLCKITRHGEIYQYTDPPFSHWVQRDKGGPATKALTVGSTFYQLRRDNSIWEFFVMDSPSKVDWRRIDNNPATAAIASNESELFQLHNDGKIWKYTGTPMTGWIMLDNNPATVAIVTVDNSRDLYQLHADGKIWEYTGEPMTGWIMLDNNPRTVKVVASAVHFP